MTTQARKERKAGRGKVEKKARLEEGHCHTAAVGVDVGQHHDVLLAQDLIALRGGGPVGSLSHQLQQERGRKGRVGGDGDSAAEQCGQYEQHSTAEK